MLFLVFTVVVLHLSRFVQSFSLEECHSVSKHKLSIKLQEDESSASRYRTYMPTALIMFTMCYSSFLITAVAQWPPDCS